MNQTHQNPPKPTQTDLSSGGLLLRVLLRPEAEFSPRLRQHRVGQSLRLARWLDTLGRAWVMLPTMQPGGLQEPQAARGRPAAGRCLCRGLLLRHTASDDESPCRAPQLSSRAAVINCGQLAYSLETRPFFDLDLDIEDGRQHSIVLSFLESDCVCDEHQLSDCPLTTHT